MKTLTSLAAIALAAAGYAAHAATPPAPPAPSPVQSVTGEVLETKDVDSYTYLRLKTKDGETWAAVPTTTVKKGAQVTIANPMTMNNFESKTLKKTFDKIVFGQIVDPNAKPAPMMAAPAAPAAAGSAPAIKVAKATGADAKSVSEIVTGKAGLKDKPVSLHAQVVKFNGGILGKNWVHVRDGSGSAADGSNDILVTTQDVVAVGDVVNVKGTVRLNIDLGSGYAYPVLIENASVKK
jgi:hypothetical protein